VVVPGPLQTAAYITTIARGRRRLLRSADWEQRAGDERRDRQALLHREHNPLALHALIHEAALRTVIGGPEIMAAQLDHLLAMGKLPNVTIQSKQRGERVCRAVHQPEPRGTQSILSAPSLRCDVVTEMVMLTEQGRSAFAINDGADSFPPAQLRSGQRHVGPLGAVG
jgi:hypothetical protein